jgi:drug/metabolite transporter (DMT)-like permease
MNTSRFAAHLVAIGCVCAIAVGQVLFKLLANMLHSGRPIGSVNVLATGAAAGVIYAGSTIAWIWLLQFIEISKVYPYFALAFIIVPIAGYLIFGEVISTKYMIGVALISAGIVLATSG